MASRLAMRSSLLPDGAGDFLRRRSIETAGLALILFAIFVTLTLITYSSADPSLSHATSAPARNLGWC
jgi:S-DNA-T family DNA segregation ATPase FtsK/SpoIIIE